MNGLSASRGNAPATLLTLLGLALGGASYAFLRSPVGLALAIAWVLAGLYLGASLKMADQWEKAIVLRFGRLKAVRGAGLFLIVPVIDRVAMWIDQRIQTTQINAEQALSRDTVPVNIDAIVFWQVRDAERAALEIADYRSAIERVAQTSLREMVGSSLLATLLSDRKEGDALLRTEIGRKTADWGVAITSVEIRDIGVPDTLQDAMSRQAQAERERQARILLAQAEQEVAERFVRAAETYASTPAALQLRAMNIIYETTKERGATILIPSAMVDSMNPLAVAAFATKAEETGR